MNIPTRLQTLLSKSMSLDGAVKTTIAQFKPWIANSNLPFFPEYTKHDIDHIESVLATASSLIRDEAWPAITPADAAVLILAVLLHDCAMHLSEDGFIALLSESWHGRRVPGMDDPPWNVLWEDFLGEASRFDGRKLIELFGSPTPTRRPPLDANQLTRQDRLLIGEFLRRNHPRLAQEIAHFGVPTPAPSPLVVLGFSGPENDFPALAGLVARSHGAHLRAFFGVLTGQFDLREFRGVHAVFLMTLLRVADYLQVEAERAPAQSLAVRKLASPVSAGEWKAHQAIRDVRQTHDDPEAIFIDAVPQDVRTFLKIQSWLTGIQKEMDDSWAVIGEVYGRLHALQGFGMQLRRVRSSLDDVKAFGRKIDYVPQSVRFRAADADLLKLLIEPLYGARPEVALRELIQNSVDAVRELRTFRSTVSPADVPQIEQSADVVVSIAREADGHHWVTVSDKGIGMTPEIVVNYFLTAGASFRRSEDWRKIFEDEEGRSKVLRGGRFGVGALASFLLGPEIEVSTRHVSQPDGVRFVASVDSDLLELKRTNCPVGTTLRIKISEAVLKKLTLQNSPDGHFSPQKGDNWDWFCLPEPSILRRVDGEEYSQKFLVPEANTISLPPAWRRISHGQFQDVLWTYAEFPSLVCNGLYVEKAWGKRNQGWETNLGFSMPNLAVSDPDGNLPLNLQRTSLTTDTLPFDHELATDVMHDFCAFVLHDFPEGPPRTFKVKPWLASLRYSGRKNVRYRVPDEDWFLTARGLGHLDGSFLVSSGCTSALLLRGDHQVFDGYKFDLTPGQALINVRADAGLVAGDQWLRSLLELVGNHPYGWQYLMGRALTVLRSIKPVGVRVLTTSTLRDRAFDGKLPKRLWLKIKSQPLGNELHLLTAGTCPTPGFNFEELAAKCGHQNSRTFTVGEIYFAASDIKPSPLAAHWMEVFKHPILPFDQAERRRELAAAFEILRSHLARHERNPAASRLHV